MSPRRIRNGLLLCCYLLAAVLPQDLFACRYNVRETGFVDFGLDRYQLVLPRKTDAARLSEAERRTVEELLANSNVVLTSGGFSSSMKIPERFGSVLLFSPREDLAPLELTAESSSPGHTVDPSNSGPRIPLRSLNAAVQMAAISPLREQISLEATRNYAVVLLIHGSDPQRNESAWNAIHRAIREINEYIDMLPKPIKRRPSILTLEAADRERERVLLWSLGIEGDLPVEPSAAVLYGKARWIGPLLEGSDITEDSILRILSVVGLDCECGMDPQMMRGIPLPIRWNTSLQEQVVCELGFDPENPLVKTEVSQILRLRSRLFSDLVPPARKGSGFDDLPVPFIDDVEMAERQRALTVRLGLFFCAAVLVVVAIGITVRVRSRQQ